MAADRAAAPSAATAVDTIPVAMTSAKYPGNRCRMPFCSRVTMASRCARPGSPMSAGGADLAPPVVGGSRLVGPRRAPLAVDDVGPPQVPHRVAPRVAQPAERPDGQDDPGGRRVDLVEDRGVGYPRYVRLEAEQGAEPGCDRGPVVIAAAEQVDADRGRDPGEDDDQ